MKVCPGITLLGYTILREIGEGGMGKVYLAENAAIGQQVAIKVLDPVLARNPELRERFNQEARIQVALQHNNIVRILNAQSSDVISFLVMEYIDGESLDRVLKRRGKLSADEAIKIMRQVLDAVGYAHSKGIVHRDLKPSNILVCADGTAKVTDFGIAKVLGDTKLTRTGTSMGSPDYMSPEQVLGKKDIDHRTDIYSLGATLYEILTGRPPFVIQDGKSTDSDFLVKQAHVQQTPQNPKGYNETISDRLCGIVLSALSKLPSERIPSCERFAEELFDGVGESAEKSLRSRGIPKQISRVYPSRKALILSAITVLFATALMFIIPKSGFLLSHLKCGMGNASSCEILGDIYYEGQGVQSNWYKARSYHEEACNRKKYNACFLLGEMYRRGEGGKRDDSISRSLFAKACEDGEHGQACGALAEYYYSSYPFTEQFEKDIGERFNLLSKGCERADPYSCMNLADLYRQGFHGGPPAKEEAVRLRFKAEQIFVTKCIDYRYCLAAPFEVGRENPRLNSDLRARLQESCNSGKVHSCYRISENQNEYKRACEQGSLSACNRHAFEIRDISQKAKQYESNCKNGDPHGCEEFGRMLLTGKGIARDEVRAQKVLLASCDAGNSGGCNTLGLFLNDRAQNYQDHKTVRELLTKGCEERGCAILATMELSGIGGEILQTKGLKKLSGICTISEDENFTECSDLRDKATLLCNGGNAAACGYIADYWRHRRLENEQISAPGKPWFNWENARARQLSIFEKECAQKNANSCLGAAVIHRRGAQAAWRFSNNEKKSSYFALQGCNQGSAKSCAYYLSLSADLDESYANNKLRRMCSDRHRSSCSCIKNLAHCRAFIPAVHFEVLLGM